MNKKCFCRPANVELSFRNPFSDQTAQTFLRCSDITTWLSSRRSAHVVNFYSYIQISADDLYMSRSDCADTELSNAIRVHAHICACPNKAAQSYHCSHMHLASNYYVFFAQTTCVRQTSGKLTATSDLLSPLVIIFEIFLLT